MRSSPQSDVLTVVDVTMSADQVRFFQEMAGSTAMDLSDLLVALASDRMCFAPMTDPLPALRAMAWTYVGQRRLPEVDTDWQYTAEAACNDETGETDQEAA